MGQLMALHLINSLFQPVLIPAQLVAVGRITTDLLTRHIALQTRRMRRHLLVLRTITHKTPTPTPSQAPLST
jgi:hypothetical protein